MREFAADLRFALRVLKKNPGFTAIAVIVLALGIGANTAIFSVVNAVLLRPLPFAAPERLVSVTSLNTRRSMTDGAASYPDFRDYRSKNRTLRHLIAYRDDGWALTGTGRQAENLNVAIVSAEVFPMLGVTPLMGRTFRPDEDDNPAASPRTIVISHKTWQKTFSGDPRIIGRSVTLAGKPFTIVGVLPSGFNFPVRNDPFDAWSTFSFSNDLTSSDGSKPIGEQRGSHYLEMAGELKPGVDARQAKADLDVITAGLAKKYPDTDKYRGIRVVSMLDRLVERMRPILLLLLAAVGCVLLVACANVANLLLARASSRRRELAVRAALGAGRARVVRQVLTESVVLSFMGGACGILLAIWGSSLLARFGPDNVPRLGQTSLDFAVLGFSFGISLLTGVVFGLAPALRAGQTDPAESLREGSRGSTEGIRSNKARSAMIAGEVALALMLLASAGLLIRSLDRLNRVDPGYRTNHLLTAGITFPSARYKDAEIVQFTNRLEERLRSLPGVRSVSDIVILPLSGNDMGTNYEVEGHPTKVEEQPATRVNVAGPGYFEVMGTQLLAGREFDVRDTAAANKVVVVNEALAKEAFGGQDPIGRKIKPGISSGDGKPPYRQIVGVVRSVQQDRIGQKPLPEVFIPREQLNWDYETIVIHTAADSRAVIPGLRAVVREMDPDMPIDELRTMDERVAQSLAQPRFQSYLLGIFAAIALALTAVGLYGVIAYSVAQRTREIGTRVALGAGRGSILRLVVGQGMLLSLIGVALGLAGSLAISQLLRSLLFEVAPNDPLTLTVTAVLVLVVSLLASFVPARRAAAVDPMVALRYE